MWRIRKIASLAAAIFLSQYREWPLGGASPQPALTNSEIENLHIPGCTAMMTSGDYVLELPLGRVYNLARLSNKPE